MSRGLPSGSVTFLFSDIEGSTRLVAALGDGYAAVLEDHQRLLRAAFEAGGGVEVATEGDSFFVAFPSARRAVEAAAAAQRALATYDWPAEVGTVRVRMGLHTGEGTLGGDNYVGLDVHRAARIAAAAHGGQVLLSASTRSLVSGSLPAGIGLRDLGMHRLKDLDEPEQITQLDIAGLPAEFPPLRTAEVPSNLPVQLTSFVGRAREVAEVSDLMKAARLVTLTGPGGTGKTRLSLRVADDIRAAYPDGVYFAELAPITDPSLLPGAIAEAVGVREESTRPVLETLVAHLRDRRTLLVLDNFEQVVAGAPLVGQLLAAAPNLTILTSSREVLHVRGEHEYAVPPLSMPDPLHLPSLAQLSQYDAVALFVQRARAARNDFAVTNENAPAVAELCARLDGLPLAIELAAARVKLFSPETLLSRLGQRLALLTGGGRDLPARQQTLRGAIDWSYNLLRADEQRLFARLAVFVGGFDADTAAAVCDPGAELGLDVFDGLASFVDKSLLRVDEAATGEPRFRMLETIREYGRERLAAGADADEVPLRHCEFFAALAEQSEPQLLGANSGSWLDRLERERDDIRAATLWAADHGRIELALTTAAALWRFWHQRGHLGEGRDELTALLGRPDAGGPTRGRARALAALGGVAYWQGDVEDAGAAYGECLAIERERGQPADLAEALYNAGFVEMIRAQREAASATFEESLALFQSVNDRTGTTKVREAMSFLAYMNHDYHAALALESENLVAYREIGESFRVADALTLLALFQTYVGQYDAARAGLAESVVTFKAAGSIPNIVNALLVAAFGSRLEGDFRRAARLTGTVHRLQELMERLASALSVLGIEDPGIAAREALGDDAYEREVAMGRAMDLDDALRLALERHPGDIS